MLKLYSQIWSVTIFQQVHKCQKLHIEAERSNISGLATPGWCSVNFAWNSQLSLFWDFHVQGVCGWDGGKGCNLEWKKQPDTLSPVQWREHHHDGQKTMPQDVWGEAGEAGAAQARKGKLRRDVLTATADGYRADRTTLSSGVNSKGARRNGHKLIWRAMLHESGQTQEPASRKLKGSPALEIFKTHLDKVMSNLALIFNFTLF